MTVQIYAPHFTAGIVTHYDGEKWRVLDCAPIVKYMSGWDWTKARDYIREKGWKFSFVFA